MNAFNQIAPRLPRVFGRNTQTTDQTNESEFTVKPAYGLRESGDGWQLMVQMPGVTKEAVEISAEANQVTIRGCRTWQKPEMWNVLHRETVDAPYELVLEHENTVDSNKIGAELKNGMLEINLPKAETLKPRKIAVN